MTGEPLVVLQRPDEEPLVLVQSVNVIEYEQAVHKAMNSMRGQLAGMIESWGVKLTQERGAVNTMKLLSYNAEAILVDLIKQ